MLSMVVQVRAPKAAVTTRSVFMALPLSCFSAWIMAAWRDELTQTRGEEQICGAACGQLPGGRAPRPGWAQGGAWQKTARAVQDEHAQADADQLQGAQR